MSDNEPQSERSASTSAPVDGTFQLRVSDDRLAVFLEQISAPLHGGRPASVDDVLAALAKQEICYGIDADKIAQLLPADSTETSQGSASDQCIARGEAAISGQDGEMCWQVPEETLNNGDFVVNFDQLIATYRNATEGTPGKDVYGKKIVARRGENNFPRPGAGIETIKKQQGDEYRARDLGVVRVEYDGDVCLPYIDPGIEVSADGMEARMEIIAHSADGSAIEAGDIKASLEVNGIRHGVDGAAIETALNQAAAQASGQGAGRVSGVVVALGTPPQVGEDARLIISREASVGAELSGGRMNFRERDYPWNVKQGEVIGTLLEAKPAVAGIPVYGGEIEVRQPKDIDIEFYGLHKDAEGVLTADMDGALVFSDKHLSVVDLLLIQGDVAKETGNVHSITPVHVKGYVEAGFVLESDKDVIIDKTVEDATVTAGGTILVKGGIRGKKSHIYSPSDITVGFIENATIAVNGDLTVNSGIINSQVSCNGSVLVGSKGAKKSMVAGGELTAYRSIEALSLGSPAYARTVVKLGMAVEDRSQLADLEKEITAREEKIGTLDQIEYHHKHAPRHDSEEVLQKVSLTRQTLQAEIESFGTRKAAILEKIKEAQRIRVVVKHTVYPGVVVDINGSSYEVTNELNAVVFHYDTEEEKVVVAPYST